MHNIIAYPTSEDAVVRIFVTTDKATTKPNTPDLVTGEVSPGNASPVQIYVNNGEKWVKTEEKYPYSTFNLQSLFTDKDDDGNDYEHIIKAFALRIEVTEGNTTNNYTVLYYGADTAADPKTDDKVMDSLKRGFTQNLETIPDDAFTTSAKGIIEIAKTKYADLMDNVTTAEEACKVANEFNQIVCSAKDLEDSITDLNTAIADANEELEALDKTATESATEAVAAAEALDTTAYSEEDAAAVTEALAALKEELENEEATTASINTAKINVLEKAKAEAEAKLEKANGDLEKLGNDLEKAKEDNNTLQGQVDDLTTQLGNTKTELEGAKTELGNTKTELEGTKTELGQTKSDLDNAKAELEKVSALTKVKAVSAKAGKKKVTVKWKKVDGAKGYVIYRSLKKKSGYTEVKTIKKASTVKFTDKKVKKGKKYFYKIRAYKDYSGNQLFGAYSKVLKTKKVK